MTMAEAYASFQIARGSGDMAKKNAAAEALIAQWQLAPDPEFAYVLIADHPAGDLTRCIAAGIVAPVLAAGIARDDARALRMAIACLDKPRWSGISPRSLGVSNSTELLKRLAGRPHADAQARKLFLARKASELDFAIHEWPAGLCRECDEIDAIIAEIRELDPADTLADLIADVGAKTASFRQRSGS